MCCSFIYFHFFRVDGRVGSSQVASMVLWIFWNFLAVVAEPSFNFYETRFGVGAKLNGDSNDELYLLRGLGAVVGTGCDGGEFDKTVKCEHDELDTFFIVRF